MHDFRHERTVCQDEQAGGTYSFIWVRELGRAPMTRSAWTPPRLAGSGWSADVDRAAPVAYGKRPRRPQVADHLVRAGPEFSKGQSRRPVGLASRR